VPKRSAANQSLGAAIRSTREERGYSQEAAARRIGIDRGNYGAVERGECNITFDYLVKIAEGLDTTPSALCALAKH
jgi:transcriptional regulator with XRE-family HTH domain